MGQKICSEKSASWKILPKFFNKCQNLNVYFGLNHQLQTQNQLPTIYLTIHNLYYMKCFKKEPENFIQIQIQIQIILLHYNVLHSQTEFDPSHGSPQ